MSAHEHCVYGLPGLGLTHGPADALSAGAARLEGRRVILWDSGEIVRLHSVDPAFAQRGMAVFPARERAWTVMTPDLERLAATAGEYALEATLKDLVAGRYDDLIRDAPPGPERRILLELAARVSADRVPMFGAASRAYFGRLAPALDDVDVVATLVAVGDQRAFFAPPCVYKAAGGDLPETVPLLRAKPRAPSFLDVLAGAAAAPDFLPVDRRAVLARAGLPGVHRLSDADVAAAYEHRAAGGRLPSRRLAATPEFAAAEPFAFRLLRHASDAGTLEARLPGIGEALLHAGR